MTETDPVLLYCFLNKFKSSERVPLTVQRGVLRVGEPELQGGGLAHHHGGERHGLRLHGPGSSRGHSIFYFLQRVWNLRAWTNSRLEEGEEGVSILRTNS